MAVRWSQPGRPFIQGGRLPLDLDCFGALADDGPPTSSESLPTARYVRLALLWLRDDEALRRLAVADAADMLMLREARATAFPDPFLFFGRKGAEQGLLGCAMDAATIAAQLGSIDGLTDFDLAQRQALLDGRSVADDCAGILDGELSLGRTSI
jgi:hypothetical protein